MKKNRKPKVVAERALRAAGRENVAVMQGRHGGAHTPRSQKRQQARLRQETAGNGW